MFSIKCVFNTQSTTYGKTCSPIKRADVKIIYQNRALCTRVCLYVCVYACVSLHSSVLFLHIFHSISSVDCTAMKLHVTVLMPLHVMHI